MSVHGESIQDESEGLLDKKIVNHSPRRLTYKTSGVVEDIKVDKKSFENVRYFFSLLLEDYFGDKEELMGMAEITEETLQDFFETEF